MKILSPLFHLFSFIYLVSSSVASRHQIVTRLVFCYLLMLMSATQKWYLLSCQLKYDVNRSAPPGGLDFNFFCIISLPLASTRWLELTFSSLCPLSSYQRCLLISATQNNFFRECWESNKELLGKKQECYLCAMQPNNQLFISSNIASHQHGVETFPDESKIKSKTYFREMFRTKFENLIFCWKFLIGLSFQNFEAEVFLQKKNK